LRHAFLGDIHGNLEGLRAVLSDIGTQAIDTVLCLGDIVGYGANPAECVEAIRSAGYDTVAGNHDIAAAGQLSLAQFNEYARAAIIWTREHLSQDDKDWLANLSLVKHLQGFSIVHSSLDHPEEFNYVDSVLEAAACFARMQNPICVVGHSHIPLVFIEDDPKSLPRYTLELAQPIPVEGRMIVNPGSAGQPRDEDPRASYCIYDTENEQITFRRVSYDIAAAASKMRAAGLPELLAFRLEIGR